MPKVVTEEEKKIIKNSMYMHTIELIKKKGIKNITVEDITRSIGIAKGTFYNYYQSKEELMLAVIQKDEERLFRKILSIDYSSGDFRETIGKALKEIYLAEDSIALYVKPEEISSLILKMPKYSQNLIDQKQQNNFQRIARLFGIEKNDSHAFGVVAYLMDSLHFIAVNRDYGSNAREESLEIIINALSDYFVTKNRRRN